MKQVISVILLMAMFVLLASCGAGTSIAIGRTRFENQVRHLFISEPALISLTENVAYFDGGDAPRFAYSFTYERSADIYAGFNIAEKIGDYALLAYEGAVYTKDENGICAVILLSSTYQDFIAPYLDGKFPFDGENLNQQYATISAGVTQAGFSTVPTPQMRAELSEYGIAENDVILSEYEITQKGFIRSITYSKANENNESVLAKRTFLPSETRSADIFADVASLSPSIDVDIFYVGEEGKSGKHFTVPSGVRVGVYDFGKGYTYYYDEALTRPYSYLDGVPSGDLELYAAR